MSHAIDKIPKAFHGCQQFRLLYDLCRHQNTYLVGGVIRDALLARPIADIDLISSDDPTVLAKEFAARISGSWFWLDEKRRQSRVVVNQDKMCPDFDFAPFRAVTLEGDLGDRDFTMNAIAMKLANYLEPSLVDPFDGLRSIESRTLRVIADQSFDNDPLRIVKGVRHATTLGLKIEAATLRSMRANISKLSSSAPERIRQEVWKILASDSPGEGLWLLNESCAGEELFGAGYDRALNDMITSLPRYAERWNSLMQVYPEVEDWLSCEVEQGLSRRTLLCWVLLLQQIDPELPGELAEKWLFSRQARSNITAMAQLEKTITRELGSVARNQRALYWWSQRCKVEPKLLMLYISVADLQDQDLPAAVGSLLEFADQLRGQRLPDLVYGRWLSESLGIGEGPEMSSALKLLRNAEISGEVNDAEEAREFLSRLYLDKD